ncbi:MULTISPECIES: MarR family winged helix-turn-helix transcriptional regulator [Methylobacillus]|uniref:Transcriptional regulator, MarR family n=1 Tax=Methylobacillus flagellatus (strain ATCC 51484 / DSM 6875 / VKM B-1610 / KT) TaxID=265072 RepID=Q1GY41_METFK|nr:MULTISPECIES: MarR family transcriptional regulator [Methylobacillus]ABE50846.1 transcriptional regulator, MarR family [Methylobacillus flagellatus KT]MPS47560.1 MarR family transcriptional regulator [Methylobacillus sp.]
MLLIKELPTSESLKKFAGHYPEADIVAIWEFVNILRAASDLSDALDKMLQQHGLLQGRWWVLVLLLREDNLSSSPSELAEKAGVTKATMTGFIDGLESEGLVTRLTDRKDRRKLKIKLTPAGRKKLDEVMPVYYTNVAALMSTLSLQQRQDVVRYMQTLGANADIIK